VPAKLLVADDSTTIQKVFERTFPPEEFTLSFANNGEEALTKAKTERPQLIIADINMPLKNGFELCEIIKKDSALKTIPVLLLIGILDDFDEDESRRVGADGFIVKPFEANAAIGKVREALTKGGRVLPAEGPAEKPMEEIFQLADIIEETPAAPPPPFQKQGEEEILELADIIKETPATPPPPFQKQGEEEILELADIIKETPAAPPPPPQNKKEEFVLDSALRELEAELRAEFPGANEEGTEAPLSPEEEKEESWSLDLDLPFDEIESEPGAKEADWTTLFSDMGIKGPGQEIKDERLGNILDESATELERIEGLGLKKATPGDEEEFAEKFMEDFEPVFGQEGDAHHIDILGKDLTGISTEDKDTLAERVAAAVSHELKAVVEKVLKDKIPQLVRQEMERVKKG
jgi:CheY-like chemotaxis protein